MHSPPLLPRSAGRCPDPWLAAAALARRGGGALRDMSRELRIRAQTCGPRAESMTTAALCYS